LKSEIRNLKSEIPRPVAPVVLCLLCVLGGWLPEVLPAAEATSKPARRSVKVYVAVFDFLCKDNPEIGRQVADSVRLRLGRHDELEVIDRLSTQEISGPQGADADKAKIIDMMGNRLGVNVAIYGTAAKNGADVRAEVRCIDLTNPDKPTEWTKTFSDGSERSRGEIARMIVEALTGQAEWKPPEYGDEKVPQKFGAPLNVNGDFEQGWKGWQRPDNCASFLEKGPPGRGTILRIRTDLPNDPWLEYHRKLRLGLASPDNPPKLPRDTGYGSVGGNEGVHYISDLIPATPGQRYWLVADVNPAAGKIFVKGYFDASADADGLPELSMVERKLTPEAFARMSPEQRKKLIQEDARKYPLRYLRECYRWYINCGNAVVGTDKEGWSHVAAPFPPRGGLPKLVGGTRELKWLQIQIYPYWPAQEYRYDNVFLYKDPAQTAPLPEDKPRTPNFGKTSDVIERLTSRPATNPM
jgi:TolB-like protein